VLHRQRVVITVEVLSQLTRSDLTVLILVYFDEQVPHLIKVLLVHRVGNLQKAHFPQGGVLPLLGPF
jgi:hypothetical protein